MPFRKFQSTRRIRGATIITSYSLRTHKFQSTRRIRGATLNLGPRRLRDLVSIHAPHTRRDMTVRRCCGGIPFQSTRRIRGATSLIASSIRCIKFQSTRRIRGATAKGSMKGFFCHIFVGITCHKYVFSHRFVPQPSFRYGIPIIFYYGIFCSLHVRTHKELL